MQTAIRTYWPTALRLLLLLAVATAFIAFWHFNTLPKESEARAEDLLTLSIISWGGLVLISLLLWLVVILTLPGFGRVGRVLLGGVKMSGMVLVGWAILVGLILFFSKRGWNPDQAIALLSFGLSSIFILALVGTVIDAWQQQDEAAKFISLLTVGWLALLVLSINIVAQVPDTGMPPDRGITFMTTPIAYLLYGQKLWVQGNRRSGWLVTVMGGITPLPILIILPLLFLT